MKPTNGNHNNGNNNGNNNNDNTIMTSRGVQFDDDEQDSQEEPPSPPPPPSANPGEPPLFSSPTTTKHRAKALRGNLTREQKDRDPLFYYEVVSVLGVGSMGSVAKVKKRHTVIGGSARKGLVKHLKTQQQLQSCFELPFIGGFFNFCLKGFIKHEYAEDHHVFRSSSGHATSSLDSGASGGRNGSSGGGRRRGSSTGRSSSILQDQAHGKTEDFNDPLYQQEHRLDSIEEPNSNNYELNCAMKSIHLSRVTDPTFVQELKNEIEILKRLDHPHVVKAIETFEHRNQIFIVMELCSGGDLYSRDPYTEAEAARIVTSIVSAISYMHSKNICHRDLKYENILFVNTSPKAEVKLIDFGLSMKFGNEALTEGVGTIYTMAPEVLKGSYTKQADLWSIGVIAFMLMSSQMPFYGRKRRHIVEQIMKGHYEFKGRRWKRISQQAKAFVQDLLVVNPDDRADAEVALSASWLNRRFTATVRNPYEEELVSANRSILQYSKYSKIKKIALMICAHKSTTNEIGILRKVFQKYDTKRDGQLSFDEFKAALRDAGFSEDQYRSVFDAVDLDGTGKIRYTEFLAATIEAQGAISEERLAEAFDRMDSDDSGYISKENLRSLLGDEFPMAEIDAMIDEAQVAQDGKISYSEFLALWEDKNEENRLHSMQELAEIHTGVSSGGSGVSSGGSLDSDDTHSEATAASDTDNNPPLYYPDSNAAMAASAAKDAMVLSRVNFIDGKRHSGRKEETKFLSSVEGGGDEAAAAEKAKQVLFFDQVETIPTPTIVYSENSSSGISQGQQQQQQPPSRPPRPPPTSATTAAATTAPQPHATAVV